jgi:hypothetical protein
MKILILFCEADYLSLTTDWMAGVSSPEEARIFLLPVCPDQPWGTPRILSKGYGGHSPGESEAGVRR